MQNAIDEANRFIGRAATLLQTEWDKPPDNWEFCEPKLTGSLRRSSLDLTRALADMRRR